MTTVSGIIRDTQKSPLAGLAITLRRLGPVVGFNGGAIGPDTKTFTTDSTGLLTMPDLATGQYEFDLSVSANPLTSQTVLRRTTGIVPTDAGVTMTLEEFLTENIGNITPTQVAQAVAAAEAAEAAAAISVGLQSAVQIRDLSASHTITLDDAGYLLVFDAAATLTVPPQSSVTWPAGTVVAAAQTTSATLTIDGGAGVTLVAAGSPSFEEGQAGTLIRTAEDEWLLLGDFT